MITLYLVPTEAEVRSIAIKNKKIGCKPDLIIGIVGGFLDIEIKGIPEHLKAEIKRAVRMGEEHLM